MTHNDIDPVNWTVHEVIDLNKPISAEGTVATDERGNLWIYFGTGRYFSVQDAMTQELNLFVGIKDDTTRSQPYTLNDLVDVTNIAVYQDSVTGMAGFH